jgi:hypothetical protein
MCPNDKAERGQHFGLETEDEDKDASMNTRPMIPVHRSTSIRKIT